MNTLKYLLSFFLIFCAGTIAGTGPGVELKEKINNLTLKASKTSGQTKAEILVELAKVYYQDQLQTQAIQTFLDAIQLLPKNHPGTASSKSSNPAFDNAFTFYLDNQGKLTKESAKQLLKKYEPIYLADTDNAKLGFLIAAGYANEGEFSKFFDVFYRSYLEDSTYYLVPKTLAVLHILLYERSSLPHEREKQQQEIILFLKEAIVKFPEDTSLYKMSIAYAPQKEKESIVVGSLNKIIERNMITPRKDILFYVQEAVNSKQYDLAQRFLDKARQWYPVSRLIDEAQTYINLNKQRG